jgi:hypothetical protein
MLFYSVGLSETKIQDTLDKVFKSSSFEFSNTTVDFPYKEDVYYSEITFPDGKIEMWGEGEELLSALQRLKRWHKNVPIVMFHGSDPDTKETL